MMNDKHAESREVAAVLGRLVLSAARSRWMTSLVLLFPLSVLAVRVLGPRGLGILAPVRFQDASVVMLPVSMWFGARIASRPVGAAGACARLLFDAMIAVSVLSGLPETSAQGGAVGWGWNAAWWCAVGVYYARVLWWLKQPALSLDEQPPRANERPACREPDWPPLVGRPTQLPESTQDAPRPPA